MLVTEIRSILVPDQPGKKCFHDPSPHWDAPVIPVMGSLKKEYGGLSQSGQMQDLISKIIRVQKAGSMAQAVDHLCCTCEALSSAKSQ
jgi:hypothetical protein